MSYAISDITERSVSPLDHELGQFLPELAQFPSTRVLKASSIYATLGPEIERVLGSIVQEDLSFVPAQRRSSSEIRAVAWNIERGTRFDGILRALREHPRLCDSDILLLTELDYGMARSGNRLVAREIAEALELNYAFAPCYLALNKGSGLESDVEGENMQALHGNALFSRYPLRNAHSIALPNGKDKMRGKEKRLGNQKVIIADVMHPLGAVRAVSLHLDAHSTQRHRHRQMRLVLDHLETLRPHLPVIIGGDWNTSTYNSKRSVYAVVGFFRRVLIGVKNIVEGHYIYPDKWFERGLFRELEKRDYHYRELNEPGRGTLHYDIENMAVNANMSDWIPQWCFWFLKRSLREYEGRASLKLDWFTGKGISPVKDRPPVVISNLRDEVGPLSDHDPIVLDFVPDSRND